MIIQNSTDIKTEYFLDKNGDPSPIDVQYEKHNINPNGLVQLRNIPSIHTVFNITTKNGINVIKYNKVDKIVNQTDFTVDYPNGLLTFHSSQISKEIQVSYTNAIGRLSISSDRIFTKIDNQGNIVQTLNTLIEEGMEVLSNLETIGGANKIINELKGYVDSAKGLSTTIIEGSNTNNNLKKTDETARTTNSTLNSTITNADGKIQEMTEWVNKNGDVVNLNNRVTTTEGKLNIVSASLAEMTTRFKTKKYVAIGDSITVGFVTKPYATLVGEKLNINVVNLGISGSSMGVNGTSPSPIVQRLDTIPKDANIISVFAGTNDFGYNTAIGKSGDTSTNFYGSVDTICKYLLTNFPTSQIFFITPLHRKNETVENTQGYMLEDYVNVIRDICNMYSIPVLDFYADGSFNLNVSGQEIYSSDGLHPLQNGHDLMGYKISRFIENL